MAFWICWLVIGVFFILAFAAVAIPRIILKVYAAATPVRVKATDRFREGKDEVVVYSPASAVRKYIKSYRVVSAPAGLYFKGEWEEHSACAEYEITAYGADDGVLEVLRVKEKFNGGKYTEKIALPAKTDYASLRLVCVDDSPVPAERKPFNRRFALWSGALCVCLAAITDLLLWLCTTFTLRCFDGFTQRFDLSTGGWAALLGWTAFGVTAITALILFGGFFMRKKEDGYAG